MGFFKRKQPAISIIDRIYTSEEAKMNALAALATGGTHYVFVFWFEKSRQDAELFFNNKMVTAECYSAREIRSHHLTGKSLVFGEHYPLHSKEKGLFDELNLTHAIFYSSLTDPLLKHFGGENIISLMKTLGVADNEAIEHKMISRSISNAQEKLEKKVELERPASSGEEWFQKNL